MKAVVEVPSGVAVVAEHFWAAKLGRDALEVEWDAGAGGALDTDALQRTYRELAATPGIKVKGAGDPRLRHGDGGQGDRSGIRLPLPRPRDHGAA